MSKKSNNKLTTWIMIAMVAGVILGVILNKVDSSFANNYLVEGLFHIGASIFIKTLKMLVVPLVLVSLICGTSALGDPQQLGRVGGKTVGFYMCTTAIAITVALILANIVGVGVGSDLAQAANYVGKESKPLSQVIIDLVPSNPIRAMAEGTMLQVIFFAILFGLSITYIGEKGKPVATFFNNINDVIMQMINVLMAFAPIGVFCVVSKVFAENGIDPIADLFKYFVVMVGILILHAVGTYGGLLKIMSGLNPVQFFKNVRPAAMMAFSTASSNATMPITLETVENRMGVKNSVASFTVPLGATVNMDGTAIMQGVATVFIANAAGLELTFVQYLMVILTATFASIGTAGVPGVGMITLAMVLQQAGLPENAIVLLLPVDRILDMCRTAVNVCGDAAVTCIVAKSEGEFDKAVFDEPV